MQRRLSAILAADVVGFARHSERDEAGTFARLQAYRQDLFEPEIAKHHGRTFKLMGDGLLAEFDSVVEAVECAVALQRGMAERNNGLAGHERIELRIGINLGDVIVENDDRHGEGVIIAARLQQLAMPGGIAVSQTVLEHVHHKLALRFQCLGKQRIKNIARPIEVSAVLFDRALPAARARGERRRIGAAAVFTFLVVIAAAFAWRLSNDITAPPPTQAQLPAIDRAQFPGSSSAASSQALSSRPATAAQVPETAEAPPPSTSSPLVGSAPGREPIEEHSTAKEQSTRKEQGIPKDQGIPVILVLPFRDLSGSPIASDLGKGIAEEFISSLATFPDFDVISSTTSLAYAGKTVPEIVKTTAAQFIIEGSIRLTGEKAFITAQLINGTTDRHLQIAQIEEPRTDPVTLQMAAAGRLRDALGGITGIVRQEYERIAWNKPDAELTEYDFYIRGHTYFLRRDRYSARDIWQEGVRRFPSSVLLLCRLSTTYNNYAPETAKLVAQSAKMQRKTRLDDWHYHWAAARAEFGRGDFQKAIAEAKATIAIAPYDAISHADLSWILSEAGAHEIAIDWINFAVLHDPNPRRWYFTNLATIYEYAGKWPEVAILAEEQLRQPRASKYWYEVLARAYNATRQEDKAAQAWSKFYSLPDPAQD